MLLPKLLVVGVRVESQGIQREGPAKRQPWPLAVTDTNSAERGRAVVHELPTSTKSPRKLGRVGQATSLVRTHLASRKPVRNQIKLRLIGREGYREACRTPIITGSVRKVNSAR